MRTLFKTDGTQQQLDDDTTRDKFADLIGAQALDTVSRVVDGRHVMFVDDLGYQRGLPVNPEGTRLYHERCVPGSNPPPIVGDVIVVPMIEFGD